MWLKLTPNMKSVILNARNSNKPANRFNKNKNTSYKTPKTSSQNTKPFTKANLHELLNELIVEINEARNDDVITEDAPDNNDHV